MKKKQINSMLCVILLLYNINVFCQTNINTIQYIEQDTIFGDIDFDNVNDYIVVYLEENGYHVKLDFFLGGVKKDRSCFTKEWVEVGSFPSFAIKDGHIWFEVAYGKTEYEYSTAIYKFIPTLDDWCLYGFCNEDSGEDQADGWDKSMLIGVDQRSTIILGKEGKEINAFDKVTKDSINAKFVSNYYLYFREYKQKQYLKLQNYKIYESLDFLNYIGINTCNVQKINDIGYFLLEAGNFIQAKFILQNIICQFPNRIVAYINLGDAYYGLGEKDFAKQAYQKYIDLMKDSGKETKIPQRVFERVK